VNELWRTLRDPRVSTTGVLLALLAGGFLALWLGYREVAALALVPFQVPYLVSGGLVGLATIGTALALLTIHIGRVEEAEERRQLAELQREALRLRAARLSAGR
jgi:hypothetical protein